MSGMSAQKGNLFWKLEVAHTNLLRTAWEYRTQVGMVDSCGKTVFKDFGCTSSTSTYYKWRLAKDWEATNQETKNHISEH